MRLTNDFVMPFEERQTTTIERSIKMAAWMNNKEVIPMYFDKFSMNNILGSLELFEHACETMAKEEDLEDDIRENNERIIENLKEMQDYFIVVMREFE